MNKKQAFEAIDRLQTQTKPLLAESVFAKAKPHEIMMVGSDEMAGSPVSFVAVKGVKTWAVFYAYGQRSESHVANNGSKATITQVKKWMDIEGDLGEYYRG
jgi:alkyl hydroperoxide reductase subunit AhpF